MTAETAVRRENMSSCDAGLPVLRSHLLSRLPNVVHGLTSRVLGLGLADGNVGLGAPRDPNDAWRMRQLWCEAVGLDANTLVTVRQVHGSTVIKAKAPDAGRGAAPGSEPLATGDALITAEPGVALMTLHADCMPILLCDPVAPAVAVVHAGWRGTVAGIAEQTVERLRVVFGVDPGRTIAYLGPANRDCCYDVGDDVVAAWLVYDPSDSAMCLRQIGTKWRFDVEAANRWALLRAGLQPDNIESSEICTQCAEAHWFSHRAQGPRTGRFGAIIGLTGEERLANEDGT
jgi:YfiH family protein